MTRQEMIRCLEHAYEKQAKAECWRASELAMSLADVPRIVGAAKRKECAK